jgi:hypothetical protein
MELEEFLDFLSAQRTEALARVREMTEKPIMCHVNAPQEVYIPPLSGTVYLSVVDGYLRKELYKVVSAADQEYVMALAGADDDNKVKLLSYSLANTKIRLREAWAMYQMIVTETRDRVSALEILLPYMYDPMESKALIFKVRSRSLSRPLPLTGCTGFE